MKIGYPCINRSIGCTANNTFRLSSYSDEKIRSTIAKNLNCLQNTLQFNVEHDLLFFRIGSSLIPFASHAINTFDWKQEFKTELRVIGTFVKKYNFRISMHPDQFIVLNALETEIVKKSMQELQYHADLLDTLELSLDAKIQLHVGGVYGDKEAAMQRFVKNYRQLSDSIKTRLVIEHDHNRYSFADCYRIYQETGVPIVVDTLHHECLNHGEQIRVIMEKAAKTWQKHDGILMVDYSTQKKGAVKGAHAEHLEVEDFRDFLRHIHGIDCDIMLEVKDKEQSAIIARKIKHQLYN